MRRASSGACKPIDVTNLQSVATPFSSAFSTATSTAWGSLSPPTAWRFQSLAMAMAKMPLPQPTSTALAVSAGSSVASISRQPRVVACVPVPKAMPASISRGSSPAGTPSRAWLGWTQNGPTRKGRKERWFSATQSMSGSSSHCQLRSVAAATLALSPWPKISMRHGPSRDTSWLVTMKPNSDNGSNSRSRASRWLAGTTRQAFQPFPWPLKPPR